MATDYEFDVLYLGAGHGSFDGAGPLAASGKKVAIIESGLIGGTCPNRGCNAKITLDTPVKVQREVERLQGIVSGEINIEWPALIAHKRDVIRPLPDAIAAGLDNAGVRIIHGHGMLTDAHTITVEGHDYTAENIVVATGLRPNEIDIPGAGLAHNSTDFMELDQLPKRIAILGAGYIAMEFATMARAAGADVTVFMHGDQALRQFHQPFVEAVIDDMIDRGVKFVRNANLSALSEADKTITVHYGANETLDVDWVLDATGRIPNIENIGLDELGVETNEHGIVVNEYLQTTVPSIYASGDVIDKDQPKLTPTATFESYYLYQRFSGQSDAPINYPAIPTTVFTSPRIAKVGVSPEVAETRGGQVVHNHVPDDWYRQIDQQTLGDSLLVFDDDHHLIGVTEMSEQAEDAINTLLPAIVFQYDRDQMWQLAHLFPSISASAWHKIR